MGIYFRDILLTRISRGANNCGQHPLEKNIYFIMRFSPHFQLFYFNDRLEFSKFFEGKIKRINNADLFSQLPLLIFIKGANISGGHCIYIYIYIYSTYLNPMICLMGSSDHESPQICSKPTENMDICMNHQIILKFSLSAKLQVSQHAHFQL